MFSPVSSLAGLVTVPIEKSLFTPRSVVATVSDAARPAMLRAARSAAIGPVTPATVRENGLYVDPEGWPYTIAAPVGGGGRHFNGLRVSRRSRIGGHKPT
jgi:hypothetical protein